MRVQGSGMLRVRAVADRYDVSTDTIYRAIESGELEALKLGGSRGTLRVPESALPGFEARRAQAALGVAGGSAAASNDGVEGVA